MNAGWYGVVFAVAFVGVDIGFDILRRRTVRKMMALQQESFRQIIALNGHALDAVRALARELGRYDPAASARISQELARATARELGFEEWPNAQPPAADDSTPVLQ